METLHPGIYSQDIDGNRPIEGLATSIGAFVGIAPKGAVNKPVFVAGWEQYCKEFGGLVKNSYLGYSVKLFFENGGTKAYIVRVVHTDEQNEPTSKASKCDIIKSGEKDKVLAIAKAKSDGVHGDNLTIKVEEQASTPKVFTITIKDKELNIVEVFKDLTDENVEQELSQSNLINFDLLENLEAFPETSFTGGNDGLEGIADKDYVGDSSSKIGLHALDNVDVNMINIAGGTSKSLHVAQLDYASSKQKCMAFLDAPKGMKPQDIKEYTVNVAKLSGEDGVLYYPWLNVSDPLGVGKSPTRFVPPCGMQMGLTARVDAQVGCWRAPAGTKFKVRGVLDVEYNVSDSEQDILNPEGINCIRAIPREGIVTWGARTLSKGEFKYINVRRTNYFIKASLESGLLWSVFYNNDTALWNGMKLSAEQFLRGLWKEQGLQGDSADKAFYVKCDGSINTPDVVDSGKTYMDVGVAYNKPSEFVVIRLGFAR